MKVADIGAKGIVFSQFVNFLDVGKYLSQLTSIRFWNIEFNKEEWLVQS